MATGNPLTVPPFILHDNESKAFLTVAQDYRTTLALWGERESRNGDNSRPATDTTRVVASLVVLLYDHGTS